MEVPGHIVVAEGVITTEGTNVGFTTIVIKVLVAVVVEIQAAFEVNKTANLSPFTAVVVA